MNRADGRVLDGVFTLAGMLFATLVGLAFLWLENPSARFTAFLWALACLVAGGFLGFLFGIPRVLQHDPIAPPRQGPAGPSGPAAGGYDDAEGGYRMQVNTNLEQISDWLTKIIVGVGLIELRELPGVLNRAAGFIAVGLGASPAAKVQALALILYFGVLGFLGMYIQTRLYLQGAFRCAEGIQAWFPSPQRSSNRMFLPSIQPSSLKPSRKACQRRASDGSEAFSPRYRRGTPSPLAVPRPRGAQQGAPTPRPRGTLGASLLDHFIRPPAATAGSSARGPSRSSG